VNEELRARLAEHIDPDHECTPYRGGCGTPHYRFNHTVPRWLENWPDYSDGRLQAEEAREIRDWGSLD
jgi:hypothetical protein